MFRDAAVLFLYTETPLHAGSGSSVAEVDLPIQRERHTDYPMVQGSGIKGAYRGLLYEQHGLRAREAELVKLRDNDTPSKKEAKRKLELQQALQSAYDLFGPDTGNASAHGGALAFSDARILLFPVRSLVGVFAWITSPAVLARLDRDLETAFQPPLPANPHGVPHWRTLWRAAATTLQLGPDKALVGTAPSIVTSADSVVLEDFALAVEDNHAQLVDVFAGWVGEAVFGTSPGQAYAYWKDRLPRTLAIVHDDVFRDFARLSTEVVSRIRLSETGTVAKGALWSEENLPSDSLLYALALATPPKRLAGKDVDGAGAGEERDAVWVLKQFETLADNAPVIQLGGDETVGRGIVRARLHREPTAVSGQPDKPPAEQELAVAAGGAPDGLPRPVDVEGGSDG